MKTYFSFSPARSEMTVLGKTVSLPRARAGRMAVGGALVAGGCLGFLPVLGFWMIPLGLLILSQDVPRIRRMRRNFAVRGRRRERANGPSSSEKSAQQPEQS